MGKVLKIIGIILGTLTLLLALAVALLFSPPGQKLVISEVEKYFRQDLGATLQIDQLDLEFPGYITIEHVLLYDRIPDTLLYASEIRFDLDPWPLFTRKVHLPQLFVDSLYLNISSTKESGDFNYQFLMDAFDNDSVQTPPSRTWMFSLGEVSLNNASMDYRDNILANSYKVMLGELILPFEQFDLVNQAYSLGDIELGDSEIVVRLSSLPDIDTAQTSPLSLDFESWEISHVDFSYDSPEQFITFQSGLMNIVAEAIDIKDQKVSLTEVEAQNMSFTYHIKTEKSPPAADSLAGNQVGGWDLAVQHLQLLENQINYHHYQQPQLRGWDPNHLSINHLNADLENLHYNSVKTGVKINQLSLTDKNRFELEELHGDFTMTSQRLSLTDFEARTPSSQVSSRFELNYPSVESLKNSPQQVDLEVDVKAAFNGPEDLHYFNPALVDSIPLNFEDLHHLNVLASIQGPLSDLSVSNLEITAWDQTALQARGTVKGLPDVNALYLELDQARLQSTRADLQSIVPQSLWPQNLMLPAHLETALTAQGTLNDFTGNFEMNSSQGKIQGDFDWANINDLPVYETTLKLDDYQLGQLLKQDSILGPVTMEIEIKGQGLSLEEAKANMEALIQKAEINQYPHRDLRFRGTLNEGTFQGSGSLEGPYLNFEMNLAFDMLLDKPVYNLQLDLKTAELRALGITADSMQINGLLIANLQGSQIENMDGDLTIKQAHLNKSGTHYAVDSLVLVSKTDGQQRDLSLHSGSLDLKMVGDFNLVDLYPAVLAEINNYYPVTDELLSGPDIPQNFQLSAELKQTDLLTQVLLPDLQEIRGGRISGTFDNRQGLISLVFQLQTLVYGDFSLDSIKFKLNSHNGSMDYQLMAPSVGYNDYTVTNSSINGALGDDSLSIILNIPDDQGKDWYNLGVLIQPSDNYEKLKFLAGDIMFNYELWNVANDNSIILSPVPDFNQVSFTSEGREVSIETNVTENDSTLYFRFKSFQLESLVKLLEDQEPLIRGTVDGDLQLAFGNTNVPVNSELRVKDLVLLNNPVGNLILNVNDSEQGSYAITARLTGLKNDINVHGLYQPATQFWDFKTEFKSLNLALVQPFTNDIFSDMQGVLRGEVTFQGKLDQPRLTGNLSLEQTVIQPTFLNTPLKINGQHVKLENDAVNFSNFKILDSLDNTAEINGQVFISNLPDATFDLQLTTENFLLMNSQASSDALYHGKLIVDSKLDITGGLNEPKINAYIKLKEGSDFTYTMPETNEEIISREGVVEFIDMDQSIIMDETQSSLITGSPDSVKSSVKGIDMVANIEVDQQTKLKIIVDQKAGDNLTVNGVGTLSFEQDPSGTMRLTGRYEVTAGSYRLSFYDFVKRQFEIQKGSNITWSGDPFRARLDIKAVYTVETNIDNLLTTADGSSSNQSVPVQVILIMQNDLAQPDISFEITLPEEQKANYAEVTTRLNQLSVDESELNKQVFSLIAFNRFLSDNANPGGIVNVNNTARSSVSKLLTQQLNRMANNIQGIDVNFDLQSYQTTANPEGRTDLAIALSKRLLNDRLIIHVGGNINLEGNKDKEITPANTFGEDVLIEYELTKDGRYRFKAFRRSDYDALLQGDLVETGIGIVFVKDYNQFSELFNNRNKKDP